MIAKFSLIAFCMALIMIQGVSCVEFGFSMEDANDHFSIHESYDVGTASSVEETILGDPTSSSVRSSRTISGTGDARVEQTLRTGDLEMRGEILAAGATSYSLSGDSLMAPGSIALFQDYAALDGRSNSILSASIEGGTALQYAGVADGNLVADQAMTMVQGLTVVQKVSASGLDPMAATTVGEMTFDPSRGTAIGDGGLLGLQVIGRGEIEGTLEAAMMGSSISMMGSNLQASGLGQSLATLALGRIDCDLNSGEMDVFGLAGSVGAQSGGLGVDGILVGDLLGNTRGEVAFDMDAAGKRTLAGVAAGIFSFHRGSYSMQGDGAMMIIGAEGRAQATGSLGAELSEGLLEAYSSRAWAQGEGHVLAGGAAGIGVMDLTSGMLHGREGLVGLGGSGPGASLESLQMSVSDGVDDARAIGHQMSAYGGETAFVTAGASQGSSSGLQIDLGMGQILANSVLVGASARGAAVSNADLLLAGRDGLNLEAGGYGMLAEGSENAMAISDVGRINIEMFGGRVSTQGSIAGAMSGRDGQVTAEYLGSQSSEICITAEGDDLFARSQTAAFIASGAARGKGNIVEFDVEDSRLGSDGSIAAVAVAGSGQVNGGHVMAISGLCGDLVRAQDMTGMGSDGAIAIAGYGNSLIDLVEHSVNAEDALNAAGGSVDSQVVATDMSSGKDLLGIYARGSGLKSSGYNGVGVAAGVDRVFIDFDDGIFQAMGAIAYAGGNTHLMAEADRLSSGFDFLGEYAIGEGLISH